MIRKNILFFIFLTVSLSLQAVSPATYSASGHQIRINGNSNVQRWSAEVPRVTAVGDFVVNNGRLEAISRLTVEVDATAIRGSEGNIMTEKIQESLKVQQHPRIVFRLTRLENISQSGNEFTVEASGNLTLAGVSRPVELLATGRVMSNGDIQISGVEEMKMTTWNVQPPRAMLGALRTADDISVNFSLTLKK